MSSLWLFFRNIELERIPTNSNQEDCENETEKMEAITRLRSLESETDETKPIKQLNASKEQASTFSENSPPDQEHGELLTNENPVGSTLHHNAIADVNTSLKSDQSDIVLPQISESFASSSTDFDPFASEDEQDAGKVVKSRSNSQRLKAERTSLISVPRNTPSRNSLAHQNSLQLETMRVLEEVRCQLIADRDSVVRINATSTRFSEPLLLSSSKLLALGTLEEDSLDSKGETKEERLSVGSITCRPFADVTLSESGTFVSTTSEADVDAVQTDSVSSFRTLNASAFLDCIEEVATEKLPQDDAAIVPIISNNLEESGTPVSWANQSEEL